jgi:hypothetical protein
MDPQSWIVLGVVLIFVVVIIFYYSPTFIPKVLVTAAGPFSLASSTTVVSQQETTPYYMGSAGSFSAFVYLSPMNRTGSYAACGTPNQASCTDGTFAPCPCDAATGNCASCVHIGYNSVFNISGIVGLEVLNAPDASRQGKAMSQLILKTEGPPLSGGSNSQKYIETLTLPPIPLQKWTMVTVARDGRRFDVYYNDVMVISHKTMYMPISNSSNTNVGGITSGSSGLVGQLALANVYNYRLASQDVAAKYTEFADTRGRPFISARSSASANNNTVPIIDLTGLNPVTIPSLTLSSFIPSLNSLNLCPPGGCLTPPTVRPASPLYDWTTSYA